MPFAFANPWGLLALLGVPAVLAIHFLQRRTRTIPVSTLFLLEQRRDLSRAGRRFDRLRSSIPLWLQLLMVILLAAHLSQPRLPVAGSVRRVAVVLDGSASMRVFKSELGRRLTNLLAAQGHLARRTEFLVLPDDPAQPRLYAGDSLSDFLAVLEKWKPAGGPVDPTSSLRLARERVGARGLVVYATDTPVERLPADAVLLAVGHPVPNVGLTGLTVTRPDGKAVWKALVANRSPVSQNRTWHLEWDGGNRSPDTALTLAAGAMESLSAAVPEGASRLRLVLSPDEFTLDDTMPFLPAEPKALWIRQNLPEPVRWIPERLARSVPALRPVPEGKTPDLELAAASDGKFPALRGPAILMSGAGQGDAKTLPVAAVAVHHPWVDGLSWEALAVQDVPMVAAEKDDTVLIYGGEHPLVSLRPTPVVVVEGQPPPPPGPPQLVLHFNPALSNWDRLPAAAVLMLRYCEEVRAAKRGTSWDQLEPRQPLAALLPRDLSGQIRVETLDLAGKVLGGTNVPALGVGGLRAPEEPGFLRIREGETALVEGAVAFADAREGDFRACDTRDPDLGSSAAAEADDALGPWWPLVVLLVLVALVASWAFAGRGSAAAGPEPKEECA